jgi:hypothetical protein
MIKTDSQLRRTIEDIRRFKIEFDGSAQIEDETERSLVSASLRGMIQKLLMEIERYQDAKAGRVRIPERLTAIHEVCPFLTSIRIALGWSQENLADQLGVTRQCVNRWEEHDYSDLDADTLDGVVDALGLRTLIQIEHDTIELARPTSMHEFNFDVHLAQAVA